MLGALAGTLAWPAEEDRGTEVRRSKRWGGFVTCMFGYVWFALFCIHNVCSFEDAGLMQSKFCLLMMLRLEVLVPAA